MSPKVFFISDSHYYHFNVIKYGDRKFSSLDEMHREMNLRWNSVVGPRDLVYYVGDFAFADKERMAEILKKLNGEKILIKGNHDRKPEVMIEVGFKEVHNRIELEIAGQKVLVCHYPYRPTAEEMAANTNYKLKHIGSRPEDKGGFLIHGHVHNLWKFRKKMINVSVENWNYTPVALETIEQIIKENPNGFEYTIKI